MAKQLRYYKLQSKNIWNLFVQAFNLLFWSWHVKKYMHENIVPVIDRGVFHSYVHMCKQFFCVMQSEAVADDQHLFCKFLTFV